MDERGVTFRTKTGKSVTIAPIDMLARFVQHVLPPRFVKIRHYGLHACKITPLPRSDELARRRLNPAAPTSAAPRWAGHAGAAHCRPMGIDVRLCPACHALRPRTHRCATRARGALPRAPEGRVTRRASLRGRPRDGSVVATRPWSILSRLFAPPTPR